MNEAAIKTQFAATRKTLLPRGFVAFVALFLAAIGYIGLQLDICDLGYTAPHIARAVGLSIAIALLLGPVLSIFAIFQRDGRHGVGAIPLVAHLLVMLSLGCPPACTAAAEAAAIGDIREVTSATGPVLDQRLLTAERSGYKRTFHAGPRAKGRSPASTESWAYTAYPLELHRTGNRAFCGDSTGVMCFTIGGELPPVSQGRCVIGKLSPCRELK